MKPDLLRFEGDYKNKINIVKVDVRNSNSAEYKEYMSIMNSRSVPHLIIIDKNKKTLNQHTGSMTRETLVDFVKPYVK
jgi:thioredoxin-related protein